MKLASLALAVTLTLATWQAATHEDPPALEVGAPAPALRLNDDGGNAVSIGGKRSTWTVLAFYPKALTPG